MLTAPRIIFGLVFAFTLPLRSQDAGALSAQGLTLMGQGRYAEAEIVLTQALAKAGPIDATALYNLAAVYHREGKLQEARRLHLAALEIIERERGQFSLEVAQSLNDLGSIDRSLGQYSRAIKSLDRAVGMIDETGAPGLLATVLNNLGAAYYEAGQYTKAEAVLLRGLALAESSSGRAREEIPYLLSGVGRIYLDRKRFAEAEAVFERDVIALAASVGVQHPDYAIALHNLATANQRQKRFRTAEPLEEHAISILEKSLNPTTPLLAAPLKSYVEILKGLGRNAEAREVARRAKLIGPGNVGIVDVTTLRRTRGPRAAGIEVPVIGR
jgi:tetratricopeptide (TPR) repeat protein